jgi:hypothetical protein
MGDTKDRIWKNVVTTALGVPIMAFTLFMIYANIVDVIHKTPIQFKVGTEIIPMFLLGYGLILVKDSVIEGITFGFLKMKK